MDHERGRNPLPCVLGIREGTTFPLSALGGHSSAAGDRKHTCFMDMMAAHGTKMFLAVVARYQGSFHD